MSITAYRRLTICLAVVCCGLLIFAVALFEVYFRYLAASVPEPHGQLEVPLTNYSLSEFTNLPSFLARVTLRSTTSDLWRSPVQTNYGFNLILEKTNGEVLGVSAIPTSRRIFDIVGSLESGHSYVFPDALVMWFSFTIEVRHLAQQTRCSEPGDDASVDNRRSVAPGR
jgi:hypothetical protein